MSSVDLKEVNAMFPSLHALGRCFGGAYMLYISYLFCVHSLSMNILLVTFKDRPFFKMVFFQIL